jgi:nitrate/nitrite transporter NarK
MQVYLVPFLIIATIAAWMAMNDIASGTIMH